MTIVRSRVVTPMASLVFPPQCTSCFCAINLAESQDSLCRDCFHTLSKDVSEPACNRCGVPHNPNRTIAGCPECHSRKFLFDRLIRMGNHRGVLRSAVIRIKNSNEFPLASSLGRILAKQVTTAFEGQLLPDCVIPIPSHWKKRLVRGHNCPESLAKEIAQIIRVPVMTGILICQKQPQKQALLSSSERQQNLRGTFRIDARYDLIGAHVLLVDDTITTGATANEAARVLKKAGVTRVTVAVVGRASNYDLLPSENSS